MWPEDDGEDIIRLTKENDVYGMGMIVYEVSPSIARSPDQGPNLTLIPQVLAGNTPYYEYKCCDAFSKILQGKMPQRPSDGIIGPVWKFLERCWSRDPAKRPSTDEFCKTFSQSESQVLSELPRRLELQVQSVRISLSGSEKQRFSVKLRYGGNIYTTLPTTSIGDSGEQTWSVFRPFTPSLAPSLSLEQERLRGLVHRTQ